MNIIEWFLLLIVSIPLVILGLDAFLEKVKSPLFVSSHNESIDGYVTRKVYSPSPKTQRDPDIAIDLDAIYVEYKGLDHLYKVEMIIDEEKIVFNDEKLFKSVKVGNIVDLTLEHKRFLQKTMLKQKNIFKTELKDFQIKA